MRLQPNIMHPHLCMWVHLWNKYRLFDEHCGQFDIINFQVEHIYCCRANQNGEVLV